MMHDYSAIRPFRLLPLFAIGLSGCFDLPDVATGVCGNSVVELGEDCDGPTSTGNCGAAAATNECHFLCSEGNDTDCPQGWGCGQDGVCRLRTGVFLQTRSYGLGIAHLAVGDVDGDGFSDVVGADNGFRIVARYGQPTNELSEQTVSVTRTLRGEPTFEDINFDRRLDVVVPTNDGLSVLLGATSRGFSPLSYASFSFESEIVRYAAVGIPSTAAQALLVVDNKNKAIHFKGSEQSLALPNGVSVTKLLLPIPVFDLLPGDDRDEFILAFSDRDSVLVYSSEGSGSGLKPVLKQTLTVPLPQNSELVSAFVTREQTAGNPKLYLSSHTTGPGEDRTTWVATHNTVNFGVLSQDDRFVVGQLPLAAGDINNDGYADFIFSDRITLSANGNTFAPAAISSSVWNDAVVADMNGDGVLDVVVSTNGRVGVEIFFAQQGLLNRFHVETEYPVSGLHRAMSVGDFDGDLVSDIALITDGEDSAIDDRVEVIFGSRSGGFDSPRSMGRFESITQLVPGLVGGQTNPDGISDLLVALGSHRDGKALSLAAILVGDSSRQMAAPLIINQDNKIFLPDRAVVGNFLPDTNPNSALDIFAIASQNQGKQQFACLLPDATAGGEIDSDRFIVEEITQQGQSFNPKCAAWTVGDVNGTAGSELVGLDGTEGCQSNTEDPVSPRVMIMGLDKDSATPLILDLALGGELSSPQTISLANLDDDDDQDLLVLFRGQWRETSEYDAIAGSGVAVIWNNDGLDTENPTILSAPGHVDYQAALPIFLNADNFHDLIVLTESDVLVALYDAETHHFSPLQSVWSMPPQGDGVLSSGREIGGRLQRGWIG